MAIQLTKEISEVLKKAARLLTGPSRRVFIASVVAQMERGGQRQAEGKLGWNRDVIRKGMHELKSGIICLDAFNLRGRKRWEEKNPVLQNDIRKIVESTCQTDPTFRTTRLYRRITAGEVRKQLLEKMNYLPGQVPSERSLRRKLTEMGYYPRKVVKSKPLRKIKETDAIFHQVHQVNQAADADPGTIRLSVDTKAVIAIGDLSRGGRSRQGERAADHDMEPDEKLTPFGLFRPDTNQTWLFFTSGSATADFMVDRLEEIWPGLKKTVILHIPW